MNTHSTGLKKAKKGVTVVLVSEENGKLVFQSEVINRGADAEASMQSLADAWNDPKNILEVKDDVYTIRHRFAKNAGPKKKTAAPKKAPAKKAPAKKRGAKRKVAALA